jgi:hypothetical protein
MAASSSTDFPQDILNMWNTVQLEAVTGGAEAKKVLDKVFSEAGPGATDAERIAIWRRVTAAEEPPAKKPRTTDPEYVDENFPPTQPVDDDDDFPPTQVMEDTGEHVEYTDTTTRPDESAADGGAQVPRHSPQFAKGLNQF